LPRHEKDLYYLMQIPDGIMEQEYSYKLHIYQEKPAVNSTFKLVAKIEGKILAMSEKNAKEKIYSMFENTLPEYPKENRQISVAKV